MSFTQNTATGPLNAFFDTKGSAQQAVSDVEAAGVPYSDISMVEGGGAASRTASARQHESFLAALKDLFMPEKDCYSFAGGLRRGLDTWFRSRPGRSTPNACSTCSTAMGPGPNT